MKNISAKILGGLLLVALIFSFSVPAAQAALSSSQVNSILSLIMSFGADQSTIGAVGQVLLGTGSSTGSTSGSSTPGTVSTSPLVPSQGVTVTPEQCEYVKLMSITVSRGSANDVVTALQYFLIGDPLQVGAAIAKPLGRFDLATEQALQVWQKRAGLVSSGTPVTTGYGVLGPTTRAYMKKLCDALPKAPAPNPPSISIDPITLTYPNGGEVWEPGIYNTITWTPYSYNPDVNPASSVKAYLDKKQADGTFFQAAEILPSGKASIHTDLSVNKTGGAGGYGIYPDPGEYYFRVVNTVTGASDRSNGSITVPKRTIDLKVNGSDGPISVVHKDLVTLTWTNDKPVKNCSISGVGSTLGALSGYPTIQNVAASGSQKVYVYAPGGFGTTVSLSCLRSDGVEVYDYVIVKGDPVPAKLSIEAPNTGGSVEINKPYTIRWVQAGLQQVSIALYMNDKWYSWIVKGQRTGSAESTVATYEWTPPVQELGITDAGKVFKIYMSGLKIDGTGSIEDKSDLPFAFSANTGTITPTVAIGVSPGSIVAGQQATINWSSSNATRCSFSDGSTEQSVATIGTRVVNPTITTVYSVICVNDPGTGGQVGPSAAKSISLAVTPVGTEEAGNAELHAVGVYEAAGSSHNICKSTPSTVTVNLVNTGVAKPVILSLSAYETVRWLVKVPQGVTVRKVILSGYNPQILAMSGVEAGSVSVERHIFNDRARRQPVIQGAPFFNATDKTNTPSIYFTSYADQCTSTLAEVPESNRLYIQSSTDYFYGYEKNTTEYNNLISQIESITGLKLKSFSGAYSGSSFTVTVGSPSNFAASVSTAADPYVQWLLNELAKILK
jgi:hypothetical protein